MTDTGTAAAEPITLEAFDPATLLMDANARSNAEGTVTKADVALCTTIAGSRPDYCLLIPASVNSPLRIRSASPSAKRAAASSP